MGPLIHPAVTQSLRVFGISAGEDAVSLEMYVYVKDSMLFPWRGCAVSCQFAFNHTRTHTLEKVAPWSVISGSFAVCISPLNLDTAGNNV